MNYERRMVLASVIGMALCLLGAVASGGEIDVTITGPTAVESGGFALRGDGPDNAVLRWRIDKPEGAQTPLNLRDAAGNPVLVFLNAHPGEYDVVLTAQIPQDGLDPFGEAVHEVLVGGSPPPGPGPNPPGPGPGPPDPPEPDAAPFPADGLAVLLLYETEDASALERGQRAILFGRETREFLNKTTDDRYRIWDDDTDASKAEKPWPAAMKVEPESLPWVVISNGKTGFSGPLPATPDEFRTLLEEYR